MSDIIINITNYEENCEPAILQTVPKSNITPKKKHLIPFTKKWRVKLYILNEEGQWDDKSIGFVFLANETEGEGGVDGGMQKSTEMTKKMIVIKEDTEDEIVNINIANDNFNFHNQRGTILTWREGKTSGEDNYAISFQEKEGVVEIVKNFNIIKGKNDYLEDSYKNETNDIYLKVSVDNLPNIERELGANMNEEKVNDFIEYLKETNCQFFKELGLLLNSEEKKLEELKSSVSVDTNLSSNTKQDKIEIQNDDVQRLINMSDTKANKKINYLPFFNENINYIFNIFKNLILIGDKDLLEYMFDDEFYLVSFGALEHDPQERKIVPHRKYFNEIVKFKNPLDIKDF